MKESHSGKTLYPDGHFGRWTTDDFGLPAYEYTCDQDADPAAAAFTTQGPSNLHWHQIGNDRITAIATNRGYVQALESSRGLQWLNFRDPARLCPGGGIALVRSGGPMWTDLFAHGDADRGMRRIFGTGYFRKIKTREGVRIDHRILAPFGDDPALVAEIVVENTSAAPRRVDIHEFFGINLHYLSAAPVYTNSRRTHFFPEGQGNPLRPLSAFVGKLSMFDVEQQRDAFANRFRFDPRLTASGISAMVPRTSYAKPPRDRASKHNDYPSPLFLAPLMGRDEQHFSNAAALMSADGTFRDAPIPAPEHPETPAPPCLCCGASVTLPPGGTATFAWLFGYAELDDAERLAQTYRAEAAKEGNFLSRNAAAWRPSLPMFTILGEDAQWAPREAQWNVYYTRSALLHDSRRRNHYLPQGSAYEFLQGLRGAVRDLAIFLMGLIYISPRRAAEVLEYCFRLMTPEGRLMYAATNNGEASGFVAHDNPSDLGLFLLWALTEYVFFTGDRDFLDRVTPFHPPDNKTATIHEKSILALRYLYKTIGVGEHGLLRVGDGDWSDGISLFAGNRWTFVRHGESVLNSAMALYVLPRVADLLDPDDAHEARRAREFAESLRRPVLDCFNGEWFYRGYDGSGRPIGDKELFLDHHVWLLISRALPDDMTRSVVDNIRRILDDPSPFGQRVLHPPKKTTLGIYAPGWDVNGGVWYAIDNLLAWGYSRTDPQLAWRAYRKNSLAMKATVDPKIWYGIWSGPDSINAYDAERPGETFYHPPTPMTDFPVMNLNLHAGSLAALIKLCGVEPDARGINVRPALPFADFSLETPTFFVESVGGKVAFTKKDIPEC